MNVLKKLLTIVGAGLAILGGLFLLGKSKKDHQNDETQLNNSDNEK
ncbi:MAG TPA: hypothetical protein ACFCUD_09035 [Cyclobacteriaceae bacterium]